MSDDLRPATAVPRADQVPRTFDQALDPAWLTVALAPVTGSTAIAEVQVVEVLRTMATKVRFTVRWEGPEPGRGAFCLKAFLDVDAEISQRCVGHHH